jgi:hypothetical protein
MAKIIEIDAGFTPDAMTTALEDGDLLLFRHRPFTVLDSEKDLIDPAIFSGSSKNVSYNSADGSLKGVALEGADLERCRAMLARFADFAEALARDIAPTYGAALQRRRTSFRPGEVSQRVLSPRKDDRRLHVDAFPANPTGGKRILRIFSNVNPDGRPRHWRIGGLTFPEFAAGFKDRVKPGPSAPTALALRALGVTKGLRTRYDGAMLQLHDIGKADDAHQAATPQEDVMLPAGASWAVYTDTVLHAAMAGQHLFEQTFLLPPEAMLAPEKAPVRVLEKLFDRALV